MPTPKPNRKRNPPATRRRALELLDGCGAVCTEALMRAHGFTVEQMVELVCGGLASAQPERVVACSRRMGVARVRITDAGRRTLASDRSR